MKPIDQLTEEVIGLAMKVHRTLGPGFLESVYQKALLFELARAGWSVDSEKSLKVIYEGTVVGDFVADLLVDGRLIVELKAVQDLTVAHEVQTVNYLAATGLDDALLINFGASSLQFKRKRRLPKSK
jgi:GxxExxY protein